MALDLRQLLDGCFRSNQQALHIDASALKQGLGPTVLAQHGCKHMGRFNEGVVLPNR